MGTIVSSSPPWLRRGRGGWFSITPLSLLKQKGSKNVEGTMAEKLDGRKWYILKNQCR
jgi:hypothetical protein